MSNLRRNATPTTERRRHTFYTTVGGQSINVRVVRLGFGFDFDFSGSIVPSWNRNTTYEDTNKNHFDIRFVSISN